MISACADELRALVRSGWRLVALESFEEDRALTTVDEVEVRARVREAAAQIMQGYPDSGTVAP